MSSAIPQQTMPVHETSGGRKNTFQLDVGGAFHIVDAAGRNPGGKRALLGVRVRCSPRSARRGPCRKRRTGCRELSRPTRGHRPRRAGHPRPEGAGWSAARGGAGSQRGGGGDGPRAPAGQPPLGERPRPPDRSTRGGEGSRPPRRLRASRGHRAAVLPAPRASRKRGAGGAQAHFRPARGRPPPARKVSGAGRRRGVPGRPCARVRSPRAGSAAAAWGLGARVAGRSGRAGPWRPPASVCGASLPPPPAWSPRDGSCRDAQFAEKKLRLRAASGPRFAAGLSPGSLLSAAERPEFGPFPTGHRLQAGRGWRKACSWAGGVCVASAFRPLQQPEREFALASPRDRHLPSDNPRG